MSAVDQFGEFRWGPQTELHVVTVVPSPSAYFIDFAVDLNEYNDASTAAVERVADQAARSRTESPVARDRKRTRWRGFGTVHRGPKVRHDRDGRYKPELARQDAPGKCFAIRTSSRRMFGLDHSKSSD